MFVSGFPYGSLRFKLICLAVLLDSGNALVGENFGIVGVIIWLLVLLMVMVMVRVLAAKRYALAETECHPKQSFDNYDNKKVKIV